ncbi:MAG: hypothetical protein RMJ59_06930 [Candidatus Nitrosocaldus sp.]|nr:hypothetical protein [Candidatus Nitrosocaldus sp.]MCS7141934.1 hypothetical protein [Candidatus Nitrosocaldus sp.]MDW8000426.1 hypothetical protein [Candidatus Nitrosocaldus sp.]MDW8276093.1 hypothetical protein [Candidatus Nitrosocaldus sp.]
MLSSSEDMEARAFEEFEEKYPEELKNQIYDLVLTAIGRYIEGNNLRDSDFPRVASSALYILALSLARKGPVKSVEEAERYLLDQLHSIHRKGNTAIEEIYREAMKIR